MKKTLTVIALYVCITLFVHVVAHGNVTPLVEQRQNLEVTHEILSVEKDSDNQYTVSYKIGIKNPTTYTIKSLQAANDLEASFGKYPYILDKVSSDIFSLNNQYNGKSNIQLLGENNTLSPGQTGYIFLTVTFDPGSDTGPFYNKVVASGVYPLPNTTGGGTDVGGGDGAGGNGNGNAGGGNNGGGNNGNNGGGNGNGSTTPQPEPDPETNKQPRDLQYILIDADKDIEIMEIHDGDIIDVDALGVGNITVKVKVNPGTKGSLVFDLNGKQKYRIENSAHYVISGNNQNNYNPWNYEVGPQTLTTHLFTKTDGKGEEFYQETINFTIVKQEEEEDGEGEAGGEDEIGFEITPEPGEETGEGVQGEETGAEAGSDESGETTADTTGEESGGDDAAGEDGDIIGEETTGGVSSGGGSQSGEDDFSVDDFLDDIEDQKDILGDSAVGQPQIVDDVSVSYIEIPNVSASAAGTPMLAETGFNMQDSMWFGLFLLLAVIEVNLSGIEYRSFSHFIQYLRLKNKPKKQPTLPNPFSDY